MIPEVHEPFSSNIVHSISHKFGCVFSKATHANLWRVKKPRRVSESQVYNSCILPFARNCNFRRIECNFLSIPINLSSLELESHNAKVSLIWVCATLLSWTQLSSSFLI